MSTCIYMYSRDQMQLRYKARVIYTRLHEGANTCTLRQIHVYIYMVKWIYTRRQTRLHEKANTFALYLASDLYCTCTWNVHVHVHVHVCLKCSEWGIVYATGTRQVGELSWLSTCAVECSVNLWSHRVTSEPLTPTCATKWSVNFWPQHVQLCTHHSSIGNLHGNVRKPCLTYM